MPRAKFTKFAKFFIARNLCDLCGLCVRLNHLERRLRDDARAFGIRMNLVVRKDFVHLFAQGFLHVDAVGSTTPTAAKRRHRLEIGLHEERLGTAVEFLSFGERRKLSPNEDLRLIVGTPVVHQHL